MLDTISSTLSSKVPDDGLDLGKTSPEAAPDIWTGEGGDQTCRLSGLQAVLWKCLV